MLQVYLCNLCCGYKHVAIQWVSMWADKRGLKSLKRLVRSRQSKQETCQVLMVLQFRNVCQENVWRLAVG